MRSKALGLRWLFASETAHLGGGGGTIWLGCSFVELHCRYSCTRWDISIQMVDGSCAFESLCFCSAAPFFPIPASVPRTSPGRSSIPSASRNYGVFGSVIRIRTVKPWALRTPQASSSIVCLLIRKGLAHHVEDYT